MSKRIVVTGMGVVTPIGTGLDAYWEGLSTGKSGGGLITKFETEPYPIRIAAEVKDFDPAAWMPEKDIERTDPYVHFAVAAAVQAVEQSGLDQIPNLDPTEVGVLIGSGIGGLQTTEANKIKLLEKGPRRISPFLIPMLIINMGSGVVSMRYGFKGPNLSVATACATGNHAIGEAAEIIRRGDAKAMVAGGAEAAITPLGLTGFTNMKAFSKRNEEPAKASRPFDRDRDGFVAGEGAGIVVLEDYEFAKARGAHILAELTGYGMSGDAFHMTAPDPDGDGAQRAMKLALKNAGRSPEEIDYINAHGTSTPMNDAIETKAIKAVLGEHAKKVRVSSTKSMTGHLLGAAGGIEFVACVLAFQHGLIPPTINYETPDPECDLDYTPNQAVEFSGNIAVSNSFGFGGHNAVLVVERFK
jgi:3-oxoacyl-[acyl-carrier-protein] synthase II